MSGLSRLAEMCRKCPYVNMCPNKRMKALAYLPDPSIFPVTMTQSVENGMINTRAETTVVMPDGDECERYLKEALSPLSTYMLNYIDDALLP